MRLAPGPGHGMEAADVVYQRSELADCPDRRSRNTYYEYGCKAPGRSNARPYRTAPRLSKREPNGGPRARHARGGRESREIKRRYNLARANLLPCTTQYEILKCSNVHMEYVLPGLFFISIGSARRLARQSRARRRQAAKAKANIWGRFSPSKTRTVFAGRLSLPSPSRVFLYDCPLVDCKCADLACHVPRATVSSES